MADLNSEKANEIDKILDLEDGPDPNPAPPAEPSAEPGAGDQKVTKTEEQVAKLAEENKDLQEKIRQIAEQNKSVNDFFDKLRGNPDEEAKNKAAQEWLKKFDEDPQAAINEAIASGIAGLDKKVVVTQKTQEVDKVMQKIDQDYDVDWDKDYPKVIEKLKTFSKQSRDDDPYGTLFNACRLAGVIKKKGAAQPNHTEQHHRGGGRPVTQTDIDKESSDVNKRLSNSRKKKSSNVFGV